MNSSSLVCGMVSVLCFFSLASPLVAEAAEQAQPIRLSADLDLDAAQQTKLAYDAISGSPDAARKLASFHLTVRGDRDASLKWYTIGAENGDAGCAYGLYGLLRNSPHEDERTRALFWLHRAADWGLVYAKYEIKAIEKQAADSPATVVKPVMTH